MEEKNTITEQKGLPDKNEKIASCFKKNISSFCFFMHTTEKDDSDEDEKADLESYIQYKNRHPHDGSAIWKNLKTGEEYVYISGDEHIHYFRQEDMLSALEDEMKCALTYLHSDYAKEEGFNIKNGYDYALIKLVIDRGMFYGSKRLLDTMPGFINLINRLGFTDICGAKTLNKIYSASNRSDFNWTFTDSKGRTNSEKNRRNSLIRAFAEKMREIRGG